MENWNEICSDLLECKRNNALESKYQETVFWCLRSQSLGWLKSEIEQKPAISIGSVQNVYPDIVLNINSIPQIVIELKKPVHCQRDREREQLFSYMRLLRLLFGLYIGENIQLYYDELSNALDPQLVTTIELALNSEEGKTFINLFKRDSFDCNKLKEFCLTRLEEQKKVKVMEETISYLTSKEGIVKVRNLIQQDLENQGFSFDATTQILNELTINISKNQASTPTNIKTEDLIITPQNKKSRPRIEYSLNNLGRYNKRKIALAIAQLYVKNNPHLTFQEISYRLPGRIYSLEEIENKKRIGTNIRCFDNPEELMRSSDNVVFALTNQWGDGYSYNSETIIEFAKKEGYNIEQL